MTSKEYKKNFAPLAIPEELVKLLKLQKNLAGEFFSNGFELAADDKAGLATWSDKPEFLGCLYPIGQADGTGSTYAIWRVEGELSASPIVAFGSEGGVHVVADNLATLLRILTFDAEPMIDFDGITFFKRKDHEPSTGAELYSMWLERETSLEPVSGDAEVKKLVKAAQQRHGKAFEQWMRKLIPA